MGFKVGKNHELLEFYQAFQSVGKCPSQREASDGLFEESRVGDSD